MRTLSILLAAGVTVAAAGIVQPANALPAAGPASVKQSSVGGVEGLQSVDYRRGFPVYALGPIPSGFGDETRTGRPFYAGRVDYPRRYTYGYGYRVHRHVRPDHRYRHR